MAESTEKAGAGESAETLMDSPHKTVCINTHQHICKVYIIAWGFFPPTIKLTGVISFLVSMESTIPSSS